MFAILVTIGAVTAPPPAAQGNGVGTQIDCTALSSEMQEFASQLSDANRAAFCNQFNDMQRNAAIQMATQPDSMGNMMSGDLAVGKVAQQNNITIPSQPQGAGGCPAG